jgi:hypothetical protein
MESLKIGKKTYDLYLGFDFIRELDKRHPEKVMGMTFGFGVGKTLINLLNRNPIAVLDFIQAATITEKQKPSVKDIEALFDEWQAEDEKEENKGKYISKTEEMYELFVRLLETSSLTAPTLKAYRENSIN